MVSFSRPSFSLYTASGGAASTAIQLAPYETPTGLEALHSNLGATTTQQPLPRRSIATRRAAVRNILTDL